MKWKLATLEKVAEINPRLATSPRPNDSVTFVPMAAVSEQSLSIVDGKTRQFHEVAKGYTQFQRDDIIVAKITPCFQNGKMAHATNLEHHIGVGSTEFHVFRPRHGLDGAYLFHLLRAPVVRTKGVGRMKGAAGQRRVPAEYFAELPIPLPPLAEQKRIAGILDAADALRAKRREALAQLDTLLQATFLDLFGDPVTNPKGWERVSFGSLIHSGPQNGIYKPSKDYGSGTRILRIDGFYDGAVTDLTSLKRVQVSENEISLYSLAESDIVINRVNSRSHLGKCALIPPLDEPVIFESNMMRLSLNSERMLPRFATQFLQTTFIKNQILSACKDAVNQSSINQTDVKKFQVLVPAIDVQKRFAAVVSVIDQQRTSFRLHLAELDALFASLQSRAFRGEL